VIVGMTNGEPIGVIDALEANHTQLDGVRLHQMHSEHPRPSTNGEYGGHLRHVSYFLSHVTRPAYWAGHCDLVPNHFSELPHLLRTAAVTAPHTDRPRQPISIAAPLAFGSRRRARPSATTSRHRPLTHRETNAGCQLGIATDQVGPGVDVSHGAFSPYSDGRRLGFHAGPTRRHLRDLRDEASRFMVVHIGMVAFIGLMRIALYLLVRDLPGTAARISRLAMGPSCCSMPPARRSRGSQSACSSNTPTTHRRPTARR
jgi:hypothetical protein